MIGEGKAPLCRGRCRGICKRMFGTEDGDISRDWGIGIRRGSEVFASRRGDENVIGVNGNILMKRGKKKGVEDLLSDTGGSGRHCR